MAYGAVAESPKAEKPRQRVIVLTAALAACALGAVVLNMRNRDALGAGLKLTEASEVGEQNALVDSEKPSARGVRAQYHDASRTMVPGASMLASGGAPCQDWNYPHEGTGASNQCRWSGAYNDPTYGYGECCMYSYEFGDWSLADSCRNIKGSVQGGERGWGPWEPCSATCGGGTRTRHAVVFTEPICTTAFDKDYAGGKEHETEACNTQACDVDCAGSWGNWGACSATCGGGTQSKTFTVTTAQAGGGDPCPSPTSTRSCNTAACPDTCTDAEHITTTGDSGHGTLEGSTVENAANQLHTHCRGQNDGKEKMFSITVEPGKQIEIGMNHNTWDSAHETRWGGDCPGDHLVECTDDPDTRKHTWQNDQDSAQMVYFLVDSFDGANGNFELSYTYHTLPINCEGSYGAFGTCSATCGGGTQSKHFSIETPAAHGGEACPASRITQNCNTNPCPVDCVGSWGEWGTCSHTCGGGTVSRSYIVTTAAAHGGVECDGSGTETIECGTQVCPVDCAGSYGGWGTCSHACGGGTHTKHFHIQTHQVGAGAACPDAAVTESCNTQPCPIDCVSSYGAFGPCSATCGGGTHTKHLSISTHAAHGGAACPASSVSQSCNTNACPVDCVGDFGEYGTCSVECGGGTKSKHFHVTTAAAHGGAACAHDDGYTMTETCGTSPCIEPGLVLEAWDNVNGLKHLWHKEDGSLNHVIQGADLTAAPEAEDAVPSLTCKLNTFEAPVDSVADGGERISGFFTPPATGEYTFSLSADDGGKLYLGTSAESAAAIAQVGTFLGEPGLENGDSTPESTRKYWDAATVKEIGAVSDPQTLHGGTRYYISAVEVNRQGRDALSVAISGGPWEHAHGPIPVSHNGVAVLSHTSHGHLETCA